MIKKYRRKEYTISAVRWLGEENCEEVFAFLGLEHPDDELDHTQIHFDNPDGGTDTAEIGDWIVADGKRAGHSVCKDIWFRAMFEEEEPGPTAEDIVGSHRLALSFVGTEFVRQADQPDQAGLDAFEADLAETEDGIDRMLAEGQPVQAECTNCKGSGLDPRCNGEFVCPDCASGEGPHEHVWVTALDGDNQPARNETGNTWTHCGVCGIPRDPADVDTLPQWLYQRFACPGQPVARIAWDLLDESIRSYWKHTAEAVRRAVARDGFKEQT